MSKGEAEFALWLRSDPRIATPQREYLFHTERKWRFDFAWPQYKFAVEVEGVTAKGSRHQRIGGFLGDLEKYFEAFMLGWTVVRVSAAMVSDGSALRAVEKHLCLKSR